MGDEQPRAVDPHEMLLRLVHSSQVVPDGDGGKRLSSAALVFPRVDHDDDRDGVSVYVEGTVRSLGRQPTDLVGAKTFDQVWSANSGSVSEQVPEGVVEDPTDEGFWADPAHALIRTPIGASNNQRKKIARRLSPLFSPIMES